MDMEEDLKIEKEYKESKLAGLDAQLAEKMQLVADEQTILDELRDKSIEMHRKLEEEARKLEIPKGPAEDQKSVMKDRLREKLELTIKKRGLEAMPTNTPLEPKASGQPTPESTNTSPNSVVVPTTDMRFSSSTLPSSLAVSVSHYKKRRPMWQSNLWCMARRCGSYNIYLLKLQTFGHRTIC